jgi:Arabinose efflux permease
MKSELLLGWLGVSLGWLFDTYEISLNSIIIVAISKELNFTSIQSAVIAGLILLSIAIGGILFGVVGDKIGRRNTLYITIGTYAFGTLMRALTFNYFWLITWTIITGIGLGGEYGVGQALITEISPKERRGWWSGTFYSFFGVGTIIASLVGIFLIPTIGWRLTFVFLS